MEAHDFAKKWGPEDRFLRMDFLNDLGKVCNEVRRDYEKLIRLLNTHGIAFDSELDVSGL